LTLPRLPGGTELRAESAIVSRPYLDATLRLLEQHGVHWREEGRVFSVHGPAQYAGDTFHVPGDLSSASYLWAGAAVTGGRVRTVGIDLRWPQADERCLDALEQAGARVRRGRQWVEVCGPISSPFSIDLTDAPDLLPLLAVVASGIPGKSRILGAEHSSWKESDRRRMSERLVRGFGAVARLTRRRFEVQGSARRKFRTLPPLPDHRLVMAAAIGALGAERPTWLGPAEAVRKSFPEFWSTLESLGAGTRVRA
ncbi:MAG: hypothetical protein L3J87_00860, partial [Thermoplasmata archaeon]|nr:hypothetical protein [Thermoplasmata archaeon]